MTAALGTCQNDMLIIKMIITLLHATLILLKVTQTQLLHICQDHRKYANYELMKAKLKNKIFIY